MNIIICGAGQVGTHAADVLAGSDHDITVVDIASSRLKAIADSMDVATCTGNAAQAEVLREAGCADADLVVAATDRDEVNLLAATVAKMIGAAKTIARVHHSSFFSNRGLDYEKELGIDRLICPEYSTAQAIASKLRNPGALAVENFAHGAILMQQLPVAPTALAIGKPLSELALKTGTRLAAITRGGEAFIPDASSTVQAGDYVILVGNQRAFQEARKLFHDDKVGRRRVVIMGGTAMAVWLCRTLHDRNFSIRLFEINRERAEKLAEKLDWVTVMQSDPTDQTVADEEKLGQADAFVALRHDEEANIIAAVLAISLGATHAYAVVQSATYTQLGSHIGVTATFNAADEAGKEIERTFEERPLHKMSTLAGGAVDAYLVRVNIKGEVVGKRLKDIKLSPNWIVAAIRRGEKAWVPGAEDMVEVGDTALLVGKRGAEKQLKKLFAAG
ncbi:MAG: Trk system potassium transporter TrkA [Planctomycetota bacterium]|jgi:trk system potassium uptake protein TrkA